MITIFLLYLQIYAAEIACRERIGLYADNEFMKQTEDMNSQDKEFSPSKQLYRTIINRVVENEDSPYSLLMRKINDIDIDHFDAVRNHEEEIHENLNMDLRNKVVNIFEAKAKELLCDSGLGETLLRQVKEKSGVVRETMGQQSYEIYLSSLATELKTYADSLEIKPRFPKYTNEDLRLMYEAAKRITLKERLLKSNVYDITAFHDALQDRTWWDYRVLVTNMTREFLLRLAEEIGELH